MIALDLLKEQRRELEIELKLVEMELYNINKAISILDKTVIIDSVDTGQISVDEILDEEPAVDTEGRRRYHSRRGKRVGAFIFGECEETYNSVTQAHKRVEHLIGLSTFQKLISRDGSIKLDGVTYKPLED